MLKIYWNMYRVLGMGGRDVRVCATCRGRGVCGGRAQQDKNERFQMSLNVRVGALGQFIFCVQAGPLCLSMGAAKT